MLAGRDGDSGVASQRHPSQYLQQERKRAVRDGAKACATGRWGHKREMPVRHPVVSRVREPGNHGRRSESHVWEPLTYLSVNDMA